MGVILSKRGLFERLLGQGEVCVVVDGTRGGVVLPTDLLEKAWVPLVVGLNCRVPIPDLEVDDFGVAGTLAFGEQSKHCIIPWDAVYIISGNERVTRSEVGFWQEDMPVGALAAADSIVDAKKFLDEDVARRRSMFRLV